LIQVLRNPSLFQGLCRAVSFPGELHHNGGRRRQAMKYLYRAKAQTYQFACSDLTFSMDVFPEDFCTDLRPNFRSI
jgi:hypothetical protein